MTRRYKGRKYQKGGNSRRRRGSISRNQIIILSIWPLHTLSHRKSDNSPASQEIHMSSIQRSTRCDHGQKLGSIQSWEKGISSRSPMPRRKNISLKSSSISHEVISYGANMEKRPSERTRTEPRRSGQAKRCSVRSRKGKST